MILIDFFKALAQIGDPRFLRVLGKGVGITIALLIGFYVLFLVTLSQIGAAAWIAGLIGLPEAWIGGALGLGGVLLFMGLSVILMVPVASAITSIFLDDVADAVEAKHYPSLPPTTSIGLADGLIESLRFLGLILVANVAALVVFLVVPFLGPLPFWTVNGYLLGREYFIMAAQRHIGTGPAKELFQQNLFRVWSAGILMALPLTIPLMNLFIPTLGAATFTHLFHRLRVLPYG